MEAVLDAVERTTRGKNEARRLRVSGRIPAVVYGGKDGGKADRGRSEGPGATSCAPSRARTR